MSQFLNDVSYIIVGAVLGWLWRPVWDTCKKIWTEAQKATKEWKK